MKAPWKFIAELVSGRKPSDGSDDPAEAGGKGALTEVRALPAPPVVELKPVEAPPAAVSEIRVDEVEPVTEEPVSAEVPASGNDETKPVDDEPASSAAVDEVPTAAVKPPKRERAKSSKARIDEMEAVTLPVAVDDAKAVPATTVQSEVDEATVLDMEIKALREQLTQKLRLQNAQLKKMLDRYERS